MKTAPYIEKKIGQSFDCPIRIHADLNQNSMLSSVMPSIWISKYGALRNSDSWK